MPDIQKIQKYLTDFDFPTLFVEELGWNYAREQRLPLTIGNETYVLTPLVKKAEVRVYECPPDAQGRLLPDKIIRRIEKELTKYAYEHVLVAVDRAKENQVWLWVKRTREKTATPRYLRWYKGHSGEAVANSLYKMNIGLDEELEADTLTVVQKTRAAFDQEKVTKKFYDRFKAEHDAFLDFIKGIPSQDDREWYASVMLSRLMLVYFIQEKGILGHHNTGQLDGDHHYLRTRLKMMQDRALEDVTFHSFYRSFLLCLFHEGFCQRNHSPEVLALLGNVPYINGGVFSEHSLEQKYDEIDVPDEAFRKLFDFFDSYRWTLDDRPLRNDREINPDVLGYIFEKYINQKQMGAYYTKEDITGYISKNTILSALLEATKERCEVAFLANGPVWSLLRENPDRYIYTSVKYGCELPLPSEIAAGLADPAQRADWNKPTGNGYGLPTEIWRETVARRQRYEEVKAKLAAGEITTINDLITYNLDILQFTQDAITYSEGPDELEAFYMALVNITILDPTCGSGAFLFAALNILESLYKLCLDGMQAMVNERDHLNATHSTQPTRKYPRIEQFRAILREVEHHPNPEYFIYKSIIIRNLYGVDIMEEAVEICKLRLFLKLFSQVHQLNHLEPLPDIDFNIRAGNTLVGLATYEETVRALTGKTVGKGNSSAFQSQMFNDEILERIQQKAKEVERGFAHFRALQTEYNIALEPHELTTMKKQLQAQLADLGGVLDEYLAKEYGIDQTQVPKTAEVSKQVENWQAEGYSSATDRWQKDPTLFQAAFDQWKKMHQPFHWYIEFYGIMSKGGFDVIVGNPPWKEYASVKKSYKVYHYTTESCGNLYGMCIERVIQLSKSKSWVSFIVQLPFVNTSRMGSVRSLLKQKSNFLYVAPFDDRPGKLFDGLEHCRSVVFIAGAIEKKELSSLAVTRYQRWPTGTRDSLFHLLEYAPYYQAEIPNHDAFPRYSNRLVEGISSKLTGQDIALFEVKAHESPVYVHRIIGYYIKAVDFIPHFWNEVEGQKKSEDYKPFFFQKDMIHPILAILNSSLFYWFWHTYGDGFHCGYKDVRAFKLGNLQDSGYLPILQTLGQELMDQLQRTSIRKVVYSKATGKVEYDEFKPSACLGTIHAIDRVLAKHYSFTDDELDFVMNYDIKYRMGRDDGDASEE